MCETGEYPDTLVLRIREFDNEQDECCIFVIYDQSEMKYVIRGKCANKMGMINSIPFSFKANSRKSARRFIQTVINVKSNTIGYDVYNYDNLPKFSNEITYDFLDENVDDLYLLSAYDKANVRSLTLNHMLYVIKHTYNELV